MLKIGIDRHDFGVGDGGQVDRFGGVDAAGVDQQLKGLERNRRVLTFGAGRKAGAPLNYGRDISRGKKSRQKSNQAAFFFSTTGIFRDQDEHSKKSCRVEDVGILNEMIRDKSGKIE